jgi:glycerophosphoryl diester phosphodiesterase
VGVDAIEHAHNLDAVPQRSPLAQPSGSERSRPIRIAHRGGNDRRALRRALAAGVDWIEVDIWLHYGRLVARHDRTLWRLPITYSHRSLSLMLAPAIVLDTLLRATARTATRVLIDLKGENPDLPATLVEVLHTRDALHRAALCGQEWEPLDTARAIEPEVEVFFSLGRPEQLQLYLARRRDNTAPPVASCHHGLLTPTTIASLKEAGTTIIAWTVDSEARAQQLLLWGVDGITSNRYTMLNRLRTGQSAIGNRQSGA